MPLAVASGAAIDRTMSAFSLDAAAAIAPDRRMERLRTFMQLRRLDARFAVPDVEPDLKKLTPEDHFPLSMLALRSASIARRDVCPHQRTDDQRRRVGDVVSVATLAP